MDDQRKYEPCCLRLPKAEILSMLLQGCEVASGQSEEDTAVQVERVSKLSSSGRLTLQKSSEPTISTTIVT